MTGLLCTILCSYGMLSQTSNPQPPGPEHDRPWEANDAWPIGTFGEDYNVADAEGFRHGPWVRVYEDGGLYYVGEFHHGMPVNSWWYFRENGAAWTHIVHQEDPLRSNATVFSNKGRVRAQGGYLHSPLQVRSEALKNRPSPPLRHGAWSLFSEMGNLTATIRYQNGQKDGKEERYLPSGMVCESGYHSQGERHGEWNAWHDNGLLRQKITYRNGTLDGRFEAFYADGGRLSEGDYLDGAEEGSWKFYLEDGRLQHIHRYRSGKLLETIYVNGTFTTWFGEDRPESEINYRDKKREGPFREWHDQGGFVLETFTDADTGEQLQRRVMRGVQVSREGEYVDGLLDGPVYHYSSAGRLIRTEHFNMGVLDRTENH